MLPRSALAVFVLLAVVHTWPLSSAPWRESLNYNADAEHAAWTVSWMAHTLPSAPTRMFDGNIFAPETATLTYSDPLIVPSLIGAPVRWLGGSAVFAFNVALIGGLALTAWSGWFVAWRWTGAFGPALVAGALTAFNAHALSKLPHLVGAHLWGLPLTLYFADQMVEAPSRRTGVLLALVVAATAATSLYWLAFAGLIVGLVMSAGLVAGRVRGALALGAAAICGVAAALPVLLPYARFAATGATRPIEIVSQFTATPAGYLTSTSRLHAGWSAVFFRDEVNVLFAGVAALALGSIGLVRATREGSSRRRGWTLLTLAAAGVLLSFGPDTAVYRWLYDRVLPLQGLRATARFGYLYLLAVALGSAYGLDWLSRRTGHRGRRWLVALALAAVSIEVTQAPIRTAAFAGVPPIYSLLAPIRGPVTLVEVPFFPAEAVFENGEYQLNATAHWRPLMNGTSGYTPQSYRRRAAVFWFFPAPGTVDAMKREGATHLMVHLERFVGREVDDVRRALLERADLQLIAADALGHRLYEIR